MRTLPRVSGPALTGLALAGLVGLSAPDPVLAQDDMPNAVPEPRLRQLPEADLSDPGRWECPMWVVGGRRGADRRTLRLLPGRWRHPDRYRFLGPLPGVDGIPEREPLHRFVPPIGRGEPSPESRLEPPDVGESPRGAPTRAPVYGMPVLPLDCFNPLLLKFEPAVGDADGPEARP